MIRRFALCSLVLSLVLAASGCNKSDSAQAGAAGSAQASQASKKVSFLLSTLQEERYKKDQKYFEDAAKADGLEPFTLSADNDNARQLSQVEDALARGAKVLVIQPTDSAAAGGYVAKVVAYDRAIPGADFYVAHDSYRVGVLQAESALKASGNKGNFVILAGQSGHSVATEITRGYMETLKPFIDKGDVKIVLDKTHDSWSPEQALKTVEDAIAKTQGRTGHSGRWAGREERLHRRSRRRRGQRQPRLREEAERRDSEGHQAAGRKGRSCRQPAAEGRDRPVRTEARRGAGGCRAGRFGDP
jgi:D-xylose transport system substrate-binding protein